MRTPGERTSGAWTGGCVIHPDGGDETDRTAGNSYTATPHNTQGANSGQVLLPKEFAKDYVNNRFDDFFRRVYADIDNEGMCGNYEGETAQMMARAFKESRCLDYEKTR